MSDDEREEKLKAALLGASLEAREAASHATGEMAVKLAAVAATLEAALAEVEARVP